MAVIRRLARPQNVHHPDVVTDKRRFVSVILADEHEAEVARLRDQLAGAVEKLPELRQHLEAARPWLDPMAWEIVDEIERHLTGGQSQ